ncbi:polysaccharide biosynthesis tyrosine autokinase [Frondihabitans peucedani]|uniref:non-specific protein-tyrosine kinase n=2 Tax=Frondihabitans peucedani TaxID=598626 RepID=A0ABP8E4Z7_9MICO
MYRVNPPEITTTRESTMELSDIAHLLRKGKWFIFSLAIIGLALATAYTVAAPKTYQSSTSVYVSVRAEGSTTAYEVGQGSGAAAQKVKGYLNVVRSSIILDPVIKNLGLATSSTALAGQLVVTAPNDANLIRISVTDDSPERAANIADAVAASLKTVATEQLDPGTDGNESPVALSVTEPAVAPEHPASPNLRLNLGLGLVSGLGLGLGAAFLRSALDNRIRSARDVETLTDTPILGALGLLPDADKAPLIVRDAPRSPRTESFRALRTNLQFVGPRAESRSFVITSAMPSEGKTTATTNLAIALAEAGSRVLLVDADLRRPRVADIMGLEGGAGLSDILIGRAEIDDVIQPWGRGGLTVLPAGSVPPNPSELLGSEAMRALLETLAADYDVVLLDAPPLLPVTDAAVMSTLTTGVLVVAAANRTRTHQLSSALDDLERIGSRALGVILTMMPTKEADAYGYGAYYGGDPMKTSASSPTTAPLSLESPRRVAAARRIAHQ